MKMKCQLCFLRPNMYDSCWLVENLLSNRTIIQKLPMGLLPALGGIDSRPAAHLGRTSEDGSHDLEDEEFETRPFAHDFRDDPAGVGVVDDDFSFLGGGCGDTFGYCLDGVHFEEFGKVVSGFFLSVCC